jgi:hypothetical protein
MSNPRKPDPRDLSDEGLEAALAAAHLIRRFDGCLGIRTEIANLEAELARRDEINALRDLWAAS